uniref:MBL associated serine protease 1 n=1 Tax=Pelodiscus sinensis TaxID=13735 RepID=K7F2C2_PELSI
CRYLLAWSLCVFLLANAGAVELTDMFGEIQSPNFPESYPSDSEVTWNISVPDGFRIKLYFMHFDLESSYLCEYDYVKIEAEDQVLATFCGRETTDTEQAPGQQAVLSRGSYMGLTFRSDFSNEERFTGFDAHYTAVVVLSFVAQEGTEFRFCGSKHTERNGSLSRLRHAYTRGTDGGRCRVGSQSPPSLCGLQWGQASRPTTTPSPQKSHCLHYEICIQHGRNVTTCRLRAWELLDDLLLDMSCRVGFIKIKAGEREFGPFCGEKSPGRLETQSNSVQILFHSDSSGENRGWKLSYTAIGNCSGFFPALCRKAEPAQAKYTFKDQVVISCNTGYNVLKDNVESDSVQIECLKDGTWSNKIPVCKISDCQASPCLARGLRSFWTKNLLKILLKKDILGCQKVAPSTTHNMMGLFFCSNATGTWVNTRRCFVLGKAEPPRVPMCGRPKFSRSLLARISSGRYAQRGISPWIAMLQRGGQPFCGGSLLGTRWIVTAAHCLHEELDPENPVLRSSDILSPSSFSITLGKHRTLKQDDTEQQRRPKTIVLHPSYRAATFEYDLGLVELSEQAVLNDYVMPVCFPDGSHHKDGMVVVSGWGKQFLQRLPEALMEIEIPLMDHALCREAYARLKKKVTDDMICAGEKEGGKDACSGDSGGPMVTLSHQNNHWQLIGTVSWGDGCGQNDRYGVYSSVLKSVAWIKQITGVEY